MRRWATVCDENGWFRLKAQVPTKETLEQQHLDTLLPGSRHELWLIAWKPDYGHSIIQRIPRPSHSLEIAVGNLQLTREQKLEGQVLDENGNPLGFASVVAPPIDPNLFKPLAPESLMQELTAFENSWVGSLPHAQADVKGQFTVSGLREGRYLLVVQALFRNEHSPRVTYRTVQVPSQRVTIQLVKSHQALKVEPKTIFEALPLAKIVVALPCWRSLWTLRTDAAGTIVVENLPLYEGVPTLVRLLHRDGIAFKFNPPKSWHYQVDLRL